MTLIMIDGFDDNLAADKNKWSAATKITQHADYGRTGEGVYFDHASALPPSYMSRSLSASEEDDVIVVGFAMKFRTHNSSDVPIFLRFESDGGSTLHMYMELRRSGTGSELWFHHGNGVLAGACQFGTNVWRYVEVKIKLHDSTGYLVVHVDGQEVLNNQNLDTKYGGTKTVFDTIGFLVAYYTGGYPIVYIDDLYILNEQGSKNNDFLNDCRVETLLPASPVGTYSQLDAEPVGDNYLRVDEVVPDDDDYVEGDTSGEKDSYNFPALSDVGEIAAVQVSMYGKTDDAGTRDVKALARVAGSDYLGATKTFNQTPQTYIELWELNPDDSAAWAVADVDGAQFGIQVV